MPHHLDLIAKTQEADHERRSAERGLETNRLRNASGTSALTSAFWMDTPRSSGTSHLEGGIDA